MHDIPLLLLLTLGFGFALLFGLFTNWLKLSPIVGYLIAGMVIGPKTPGPVADSNLSAELAEIGVILLMFGVGLHFNIRELVRVKGIAIPGALFQSGCAMGLTLVLVPLFQFSFPAAILLGIAISVASTVLLIRVLTDANSLHTPQGHTAVGWLIVEDLLTIFVMLIIPIIHEAKGQANSAAVLLQVGRAIFGIVAALFMILVVGKKVFPWMMNAVARTRSRELFMLAVLVVSICVAVGSSQLFGLSMALGAFLAGIVVAQSDVGHEAAAQALPFRDAFSVLFFVSVGMLFDPATLIHHWPVILVLLAVILIGKPLSAFAIVLFLNYPLRTAITVAVALGQVGEFTFILGNVAKSTGYFTSDHVGMLVICSIISISVNPMLFRLVPTMERRLLALPRIGAYLRERGVNEDERSLRSMSREEAPRVIVVGFGPVGRVVVESLRERQIECAVVDMNIDTIRTLRAAGQVAFFGDAENRETMESMGLEHATHLILTIPEPDSRAAIITAARQVNAKLHIFARTRYMSEEAALSRIGVKTVASEETVVARELARRVLAEMQPVAGNGAGSEGMA